MTVTPATQHLKAEPFAQLHFDSRHVAADATGLIRDVPHDTAVIQILNGVCTAATAEDVEMSDIHIIDTTIQNLMLVHGADDVQIGDEVNGDTILRLMRGTALLHEGTLGQLLALPAPEFIPAAIVEAEPEAPSEPEAPAATGNTEPSEGDVTDELSGVDTAGDSAPNEAPADEPPAGSVADEIPTAPVEGDTTVEQPVEEAPSQEDQAAEPAASEAEFTPAG